MRYEKYGRISLTEKGLQVRRELFNRYQLLEKFLGQIVVEQEQIYQEVEQIEHHFSWATIARINDLVRFFEEEPIVLREFNKRQTSSL